MEKPKRPIRNALIIKGRIYVAKVKFFTGLPLDLDACTSCDLHKKCLDNPSNFCAPFEKKGHYVQFKEMKQ